MSSEYRYIEAKQLEAGQEFGRMLRRWRELNNWTQYTAYKWAKEAGFEVMAPSTLSVFENGKAPKPRPESFFALAEVNRRLAAKDFSGVRTRPLKDLISQAQPLVDDDGRVTGWDDDAVLGTADPFALTGGILTHHAQQARLRPQTHQIKGHIAAAAQAIFFPLHMHHGHWGFGADAIDRTMPIAVQHHITHHQHPGLTQSAGLR